MRIVVLADTHVNRLGHLPGKVIDALSSADLIIHAGDFTDVQVFRELQQMGGLKAVQGNMDSTELRTMLPVKQVIKIGRKRIGITHGSGAH